MEVTNRRVDRIEREIAELQEQLCAVMEDLSTREATIEFQAAEYLHAKVFDLQKGTDSEEAALYRNGILVRDLLIAHLDHEDLIVLTEALGESRDKAFWVKCLLHLGNLTEENPEEFQRRAFLPAA